MGCGLDLCLVDAGLARAATVPVEVVGVLDLATRLRLDLGMVGNGWENVGLVGWRSVGIYAKGWGGCAMFNCSLRHR